MKEIDIIKVRVENSNQIIMKKIYKLIKITLVILLILSRLKDQSKTSFEKIKQVKV